MDATVGARIQVEHAPRTVTAADRGLVAILLIVGIAVHAWVISHTFLTSRDSLGFARYAVNLGSPPKVGDRPGTAIDVVRAAEHPPGYPLTVLVVSKAVQRVYQAGLPERMLLSAQIACAIAGVLLSLPLYALGRMTFGPFVGFAAGLLFQTLPLPVRTTTDGLSEGLYLCLVAAGVAAGVWAIRRWNVGGFLLCGACGGFSYLVRPEGLMVPLSVALVVGMLGLVRRYTASAAFGRIVALFVGTMLVAGPYMALIGGISNKPSPGAIWDDIRTGSHQRLGKFDTGAKPGGNAPLFANWFHESGSSSRILYAGQATASEVWQGLHYTPAVFAIIGLVVLRRRVRAAPELAIIPVLMAVNAGVLMLLGWKAGYVSGRHTLLIVVLGCVCAGAGFQAVAAKLARWMNPRLAAGGLLAVVVATALPASLKAPHEHRAGHYYAGKYLERVVERGKDTVIDPFEWALFYAGLALPCYYPDIENSPVVYAVLEENTSSPHSQLPRVALAKDVKASGRPVYHWPADGPLEKARVVVYRADRKLP